MRKSVLIAALAGSAFIFSLLVEGCQGGNDTPAVQRGNTGFAFKDKLSEYGFFAGNLNELKPQAALFHYDLATPLFTDYAVKDRFILLPKGTHATYTGAGVPEFPDSTIIIKNFAYNNEQH